MTVIKRREGWPTPCATDYKGPGKTPRDRLDYAVNGETKSAVYPTPCASARPCEGSVRLMRKLVERGTITCTEANAINGRDIRLKQGKLSRFDTPTVHGDGGSGRKGTTPKYGQLNPDWEEWLMFWPVGWTDIETPNVRLVWLDPSIDPADRGEIPRVTNRRDNRPARVKSLGNGQYPLSAIAAFHWGLWVLEIVRIQPMARLAARAIDRETGNPKPVHGRRA